MDEVDLIREELCHRYEKEDGIRVSIATMHNTLERIKMTRKKKTFSDPKKQTDTADAEKENYAAQLEAVDTENCLYLDETGSYLNMTPRFSTRSAGL